jgi:hypothetical protein
MLREAPMITSSYQASACSNRATQFETRNVPLRRRLLKGALLCGVATALSIVPLNRAAAQNRNNGVAVIGPSSNSTPYGCTTAGTSGNIQQAISDAVKHQNGITQSVVDASNCTVLNITSEIYVGNSADPNNIVSRIKFILPANGTWTATFSDSSKYALMWGDGAMIYGGTGSGLGQPFTITSASGTTLKAICGNDQPNAAGYFHAEGFTCSVGAGSTVTDAVLAIGTAFDESYVGHVNANVGQSPNPPYIGTAQRVLWVHGACCSATFEDINASGPGHYNSGTVPCNFGSTLPDTNAGMHVSKLSCNYPSSGSVAVLIQQNGQVTFPATTVANSFRDVYIEYDNQIADNSSPAIDVEGVANNPAPADLLEGFRLGPDRSDSVRCALAINSRASRVNVSNLSLRNASNSNPICAIFDASGASPVYVYGTPKTVLTSYDMGPRYLGAMTVGSLPTASEFIGAMFRVTDSTPIAGEGQTCAPGGTTNALAFSNGSVWKCF